MERAPAPVKNNCTLYACVCVHVCGHSQSPRTPPRTPYDAGNAAAAEAAARAAAQLSALSARADALKRATNSTLSRATLSTSAGTRARTHTHTHTQASPLSVCSVRPLKTHIPGVMRCTDEPKHMSLLCVCVCVCVCVQVPVCALTLSPPVSAVLSVTSPSLPLTSYRHSLRVCAHSSSLRWHLPEARRASAHTHIHTHKLESVRTQLKYTLAPA